MDGQPALVVRAVQSNQHNHVSVQIRFGPKTNGLVISRYGLVVVRRTVSTISVGPIRIKAEEVNC